MRSSRLAWIAAVLTAACGEAAKPVAGPLDHVYMPTGVAVHRPDGGEARLVVASSNSDLRFDDETGGAILSIDPAGLGTTLGVNIRSFAGDLALATDVIRDPLDPDLDRRYDPSACGTAVPGPVAIVATRGSDTLNEVLVGPERLFCHRCGVPIAGSTFGDPFAVAVACRDAHDPARRRARAFVGYLRSHVGEAWIAEYTLDTDREHPIRTAKLGSGPVRALAYDAARDRLYVLGLATGTPTPLRWVELRDCEINRPADLGGCTVGSAAITVPSASGALELRSMALGHRVSGAPQRAFLTAREYTASAATTAGGRANDLGGHLLVVDLVDNALGGVDAEIVNDVPIGRGAQDVRVLPSRGAGRPDVVAALSVDDGSLWIYDDESGTLARFGRVDELSGRSELGPAPFALAVDPEATTTARVYVGSFNDSFITPVDVPLANPDAAVIVSTVRITGRTP